MKGYYSRVKQFHYFRTIYFKSNLVDKRVTSLLNNRFESMWLQNTIFYKLPEGIFQSVQEKFRLSSLHYYHLRRMLLQSTRKNKSAVVEHSSLPLLIRDVVSVFLRHFLVPNDRTHGKSQKQINVLPCLTRYIKYLSNKDEPRQSFKLTIYALK